MLCGAGSQAANHLERRPLKKHSLALQKKATMRILQLISTIGYYGAERVVSGLARQLQEQGHESMVCVLTRVSRHDDLVVVKARETGIPALDIPCSGRFDRKALVALRQFI